MDSEDEAIYFWCSFYANLLEFLAMLNKQIAWIQMLNNKIARIEE